MSYLYFSAGKLFFRVKKYSFRGLVASFVLISGIIKPSNAFSQFLLSPCEVSQDPKVSPPNFATCLEGFAGAWVEQRSMVEDDIQPPTLFSSSAKVTSVYKEWLVLKFEGHARIIKERYTSHLLDKDLSPDKMILQLGNNSVSRHRFFIGKSPLPFGLNVNLDSHWHGFDTDSLFFGEVFRVAGYTYDNEKDFTWTLSGAAKDQSSLEAKNRLATVSTRASYDFAALEGSRVIASFSNTELANRSGGIALVNINAKGDRTTFEWVRIWTQYPYDPSDFRQLLRLNWEGQSSEFVRTGFQYEDIWGMSRRGTLSTRWEIQNYTSLNFALGYQRSEAGFNETSRKASFWYGVLGTEVSL